MKTTITQNLIFRTFSRLQRSCCSAVFLLLFLLSASSSWGQIAQRGTAVSNSAGTTNMSSIQVNKPTGVVSGDIMIVSILQNETDNDNGGLNAANLTGWTQIDGRLIRSDGTANGDNAWYGTVLYRVADGTEGTSFTFTLPNSRADMALISIVAFSGVTATNGVKADGTAGGPFDVDPGTLNLTNASTSTASAITSASSNSAIIMLSLVNNDRTFSNWVATSPSTFTELYENFTTSADDGSIGAAWNTKAAAGSTGDGIVTLSNSDRSGAILLALKPCSPTANAGSALSNICQGGTSAALGGSTGGSATGGTWSDGGAGGSFSPNATTLNATYTPPSTYTGTVTLTLTSSGGSCGTATASKTLTVTSPASATISYAGSPFCRSLTTGQAVTLTGTTGGTYSSTTGLTISSSTGAITPSTSTAGSYTVTYSTAAGGGCSAVTTTTSVTITALPTATISYAGAPFCITNSTAQSVTITGTTGGTFSSTAGLSINSSTGQITPSTSTAGTYTVTYTMAAGGGCAAQTATTSVTVNPTPTVNAGSDFNLCSGQTVTMNASSNATSTSGTATSQSETGLSVNIPDNNTTGISRTRTISNSNINASQITSVTLAITHNNNGELDIYLTSPSGVQIALAEDKGGTGNDYNCTFIAGGSALPTGNGGISGNIAPQTPFSSFTGSADGTWTLTVKDDTGSSVGTLTSWSINYTPTLIPTYAWSPSTGLSATNVLNPNCSSTSTTTYTLTVTATNGCSASDQVVATVAGGAVPTTPTAAVSGTSTVNVGGTVVLTSTAGANTVWYTTETGGSSVGTGSPFTTPVQCTAGTVTYYAEEDNGSCTSNARAAVSFTVRPVLVSNPANALICQAGGSVTLSAQLTGASGITWSPNTNLSTTSGASTVASPTTTTIYTMSATVAGCGSVSATQTVGVIDAVAFTPTSTPASVCAGNTVELASNLSSSGFSVTELPSATMRTAPGNATVLAQGGSQVVATVNGSSDDGGWQNINIPFTYNFFGNNYNSLNIGINGIIQFGSYNSTDMNDYVFTTLPSASEPQNVIACVANDNIITTSSGVNGTIRFWTEGIAPTRVFVVEYSAVRQYFETNSTSAQVHLFETTGNVEIHVSSSTSTNTKVVGLQNNVLVGGVPTGALALSTASSITNRAWKFIPGADYTFQWATAGSNISGAESIGYTTPNLSTSGTVTYSVAATNPNTQCTTTQSVNITVNALPAAPNSSGDVTACSTAGNQTLAVTVGAGATADWFAASTGGTVLASGDNVLSYSTATAGTYYAAAQNTTTGCSSASRTGVTLTVNTSPAAPTVSTPVSYCQGAIATALTATATGANTLNWYSAAPNYPAVTGATALGSAPTPSTSTAGTTNYYVSQSSSSNSCESELALVAVTVNATPSAPVASNPAAYCQGATASALTATSTAGNTLYWYTVPTGGTGSSTAPTPSTATAGTTDYYVADRNNSSSCEGSRTTVTVTVNPTITASVSNSASSTSACGGGSITFTATPTNGGTPTYQWYLNGTTVGTNSSTYELASPANNNQIYVAMTPSAQTCLASSAATNSNTVTLTSTAATPTVSIQSSASTAFCPATSVTFSVNASANMGASPTYQWNLNGSPIGGATNATLVTTSLANNDQVTLTMTSSLSGGCLTQSSATSSSITSTVNNATAISTQPAAAAACLGGSQSFTVSATGTGTLTYQWKKTGSNVTGNATATLSTLTLSGIAAGDAANYTVDVTGTCGMVTSSAAALSINSATTISTQPSAVSQCAGTTANFSVTASGQGTLTYQWRKDGSALDGETNATLAVTNISTANAGQYSVIVSGGCGNVTSSNALLTVNSATVISTQPSASTLCAGNTANFSVTASGAGTLSYQWKKDGSNVGTNSSTLSIVNAQAVNAGTYTVDVTATCGTVTSSNAVLVVNPLTAITTQPVSTEGCQGQSSTFTVVATGTSPLAYQWKFGGVNISGATAASFTIPTATIENDGAYFVTVTGGCGAAVNSNTVTMVVNSIDTPTFTQVEAICYGTNLSALPTTSNNGIAGTWSPALNNTATTTYTFTPTAGQCATTTTMTITVNSLPGSATSSNVTLCVTGSVTLTADNPGAGYTINWYNAAQDTQLATASLTYTTSISATTSYFAEIENTTTGCKSENRTEVQAILNSTNFWVGGYTGQPNKTTDWFTEQNWSCGTVPNSTTNVVIPTGKTVSIAYRPNEIAAAAYSVTLEGTASLTVTEDHNLSVTNKVTVASTATFTVQNDASLVQTDNVANEGNITVIKQTPSDRPLYIYDAVMWSSPVAQKLKAISTNTPDSFYMEHAPLANAWSAVANPTGTDFTKGKGYLVRTPMNFSFTQGQQWNVSFTGVPNNGAITYDAGNMDSVERFLLVGNPYPSAIDIDKFKLANPNITGVFYFYRKPNSATDITGYGTLNSDGDFVSNDGTRGSLSPGSVIPSGQGFFVRMKANSGGYTNDGKIYFTNAMRVDNDHGHFNRINTNIDKYRLFVQTPTTGNNQLLVKYDPETTTNYDLGADAPAFTDGSTDLSSIMNTTFYRIQARGEYNVADVVPLRFKTGVAGEHRIKLQDAQGVFAADQMVIIKDNLTGVQHNLTANGDYVFTATAGTFTNRFEVVYQQAYYTALQANSCGSTLNTMSSLVYADVVNGATGYRFKVVNNTTSAVQTIDRQFHWFAFNMLSSYDYNTAYTISVQVQKDGVWTGYYGTTCSVTSPNIVATGVMQINPSQCGMTLPTIGTVIATTPVSGATGYKFRITNTTANASGANLVQEITRSNHWFTLSMLPRYNYGSSYTIEVAVKTTGAFTPYGNACTVYSQSAPTLTSCGQTVATSATIVSTTPMTAVTQYRFQLTRMSTLETITFDKSNHWFTFRTHVPGYAAGEQYGVRVAVMTAGVWSPYGDACDITAPIATARTIEEASPSEANLFKPVAYPNPFASTFGISLATPSADVVHVMVYDLQGRLIEKQNVFVSQLDSLQIGTNYPSGDYLLVVAQGANIKSSHIHKD